MTDTYVATTTAKWFVDWANAEDAELSNLKLQKLQYYAQGHHLAVYGQPLFADKIQAWSYGPVVPEVYHPVQGLQIWVDHARRGRPVRLGRCGSRNHAVSDQGLKYLIKV